MRRSHMAALLLVGVGCATSARPPADSQTAELEAARSQIAAPAAHYHQPSDDFDPSWNFEGMVEDARLLFEVGYALAQQWVPGDEFEAARALSSHNLAASG